MADKIKLFKYQEQDVEWLASKKQALLLHEMGLGKTAILINAVKRIEAKSALIVCPAVAKYNWQNEFLKFGGEFADVLEKRAQPKFAFNVCSYEYASKHRHKLNQMPWDVLIVDEAHYLKEPTSGRCKAVMGARGIIHSARHFWAATGTPAPNNASEIWVFLYTFGLTKLSYDGFIARYCNSHRSGGHYSRISITGSNTKYTPELKELIKQCSIRRLAKDELDLPPMVHNEFILEGDNDSELLKIFPDLKERLEQDLKELSEAIGFDITNLDDERILNALNFMSQSIMSLRRYHGLKKVKPVAELVSSELLQGEYKKIILFGIHKDVLNYLKRSFDPKLKPLLITGETPASERQQIVDRFQKDPEARIFIGNIQAAGTAITLTASNQVGFIEQDWVPGNNAQASKRAHRIGQSLPVFCRHFAIKGGLDEKITATITRKVKEISTFID